METELEKLEQRPSLNMLLQSSQSRSHGFLQKYEQRADFFQLQIINFINNNKRMKTREGKTFSMIRCKKVALPI